MPWFEQEGRYFLRDTAFHRIIANRTTHAAGVKSLAKYNGAVRNILFQDIRLIDVAWFGLYINPFNQSRTVAARVDWKGHHPAQGRSSQNRYNKPELALV